MPEQEKRSPQLHTAHSSDAGKKELVTEETHEKVVERKKSDNPYEYTEEEMNTFGEHDMDTPIARAWSRYNRRHDTILGPPVSKPVEDDRKIVHTFQHATAVYYKNDNKNHVVHFKDGRGTIGHESGI